MAMQAHQDGETDTGAAAAAEPAESRAWDRFFRVFFATTPHALLRGLRKVSASTPIEELVVVGRKTGRERRHQLSFLEIEGRWYVGHPSGRSQWAKNLEAYGGGTLIRRGHEPEAVRAVLLTAGPERSAAIAAAGRQPFPAGPIYHAGRRHIEAVGAYYRLEPISANPAP